MIIEKILPIIYISGPLTADGEENLKNNINRAIEVGLQLSQSGAVTIVPHIWALVPRSFRIPYECWLLYDLRQLEIADAVVFLEGWQRSGGCRVEKSYIEFINERLPNYSRKEIFFWPHDRGKVADFIRNFWKKRIDYLNFHSEESSSWLELIKFYLKYLGIELPLKS